MKINLVNIKPENIIYYINNCNYLVKNKVKLIDYKI